jgi:uncharacterized lipoprotein YmbA
MIERTVVTATACLAALLLTGCGSVRNPTYYAMDLEPPKTPAADARRSLTAAVRRFGAPDYLRQGRIVYRQAPETIGFYDLHRWATDPSTTVTAAMIDALRSSRLFSIVAPYDGRDQQEYVVNGRLQRLDEVDYDGGVQVEARIQAELVNQRTGQTLWTGDVTETSEVDTRTVAAVVAAMSNCVSTGIDRLVADMATHLRQP